MFPLKIFALEIIHVKARALAASLLLDAHLALFVGRPHSGAVWFAGLLDRRLRVDRVVGLLGRVDAAVPRLRHGFIFCEKVDGREEV